MSLGKDLKKMTKILDVHLAEVPPEIMKDVAPMRSDMQRIMKSVKSGDIDAINEITKRYGGSNR